MSDKNKELIRMCGKRHPGQGVQCTRDDDHGREPHAFGNSAGCRLEWTDQGARDMLRILVSQYDGVVIWSKPADLSKICERCHSAIQVQRCRFCLHDFCATCMETRTCDSVTGNNNVHRGP